MGKYKPYPAYKDSGVEWLGDVPECWINSRIKYDFFLKARVGWHGLNSNEFTDQGPFLVTGTDFLDGDINWKKCRHCSEFRYEQDCNIQLVNGDLLITKDGTIGKVAIVNGLEGKACLNSGVFVIRPDGQNVTIKFLFWILKSNIFTDFVDYFQTGSTINHLYQDTFENLPFVIPQLIEQDKIATFLNHETAKIDLLIEKQEKLIELLKVKRQAVISHAVTKGLDSDVEMKDSGVEWLGEIPAHWEVKRLKHVITKMEQGWSPQCETTPAEAGEWGVLKVGAVNGGLFSPSENKKLPSSLSPREEYLLEKYDLLISRANTKELVGSAAVVMDVYPQLILCDKLYRIKLNSQASPRLIAFFLGTDMTRGRIEIEATGASSSMQNIGQSTIREMPFPLPPVDEAQSLLENIDLKLSKLDSLEGKANKAITLLKERRTALISAAVTGKIDVRDWKAEN
ncbi:restriction endonuclease subunit S [Marinifilum sp. JC120]|nr:restriction endonuclease subunit S [Marinifilum sp. JC120]